MQTILFDVFNATGHYNAVFKFAYILKKQGYKIIFLVREEFYKYVINADFEAVTLKIENEQNNYPNWKLYVIEYQELITQISPDVVFFDRDKIFWWPFYDPHKFKVISISTKLFSGSDRFIPPYTSSRLPKKNILFQVLNFAQWKIINVKRKFSKYLSYLSPSQNTQMHFIYKYANEVNFKINKYIDLTRAFKLSLNGPIELILVPKVFDFQRMYPNNIYFVGERGYQLKEKEFSDIRYEKLIERLINIRKLEKNSKIIYCSLGTVTDNDLNTCRTFFIKLRDISFIAPKYNFVISIGNKFNVSDLLPTSNNFYIFPKVPQMSLLKYCDLMINHAGMNSILECIISGVPQLCFPLTNFWDQPGNAARVQYHELGIKGNIKDSKKEILKKIDNIFLDYFKYKSSTLKMKTIIDENNSISLITDTINKIIN